MINMCIGLLPIENFNNFLLGFHRVLNICLVPDGDFL